MRTFLAFVLLAASSLATSASAQPVAFDPSVRAGLVAASDVSPVTRAAAATAFGTVGAVLGSGGAILGVFLTACGPFGCADSDLAAPFVAAFVVGGVVGSAVLVELVARDVGWTGFGRPVDLGLRRGDGWRALAGAAVGTVPGLLVVALVGPSEGGVEWVAVPIAQGIGTGIALSL